MEDKNEKNVETDKNSDYENQLNTIFSQAKEAYLKSESPMKIPARFVVKYFQLVSDYFKNQQDQINSEKYALFAEYVSLISSGKLNQKEYKDRWKKLNPRFGSNGDLGYTYQISRQNFENAISNSTPIVDLPIKLV
jgi:hypothetical protein